MNITVIGAGYVGLVTATCLAEFGFQVTCVDKDAGKVERLSAGFSPIYEPGLEQLLETNLEAGRLTFTTALKEAVRAAGVIFLAVGTPAGDSGKANLTHLYAAAEEMAEAMASGCLIVVKSTVPVGTTRKLGEYIQSKRPGASFSIASNPEFLREGSAIEDFMRPDRIVAGAESEHARATLETLYRPLTLNDTSVLHLTSIESAEMIKYAANAFLAMKVAFINEISDLCEKLGGNVHQVARGIGSDKRIGPYFLNPGPGFGGSCFPKDTLALTAMAKQCGAPSLLVEAVVRSNEQRKQRMVQKIIAACGGSVQGKALAILGLTFKPDTDDMRDAPSLAILPALLKAGAQLRAYDPQGMDNAQEQLPPAIAWCKDAYEAMEEADALVILTEWKVFRSLDLERLKSLMRRPLVIDLRNIYKRTEMRQAGIVYYSLGREPVTA